MALLDLQSLEPAGRGRDCDDDHDYDCDGGSSISLLLCG